MLVPLSTVSFYCQRNSDGGKPSFVLTKCTVGSVPSCSWAARATYIRRQITAWDRNRSRAALQLFHVSKADFTANQLSLLADSPPHVRNAWVGYNSELQQSTQVGRQEVIREVNGNERYPGFLGLPSPAPLMKTVFRPFHVQQSQSGQARSSAAEFILVMVVEQYERDVHMENSLRMVEMCDNHPMFQFLFDDSGTLLAANKRAMLNLKEHLGTRDTYTLQMYLGIGEHDKTNNVTTGQMYDSAMNAIFVEGKLCHRFPQLRASKRHPGKQRWVLYEMWPLNDPILQKRCALVTEQNITQVKELEEQFRTRNEELVEKLKELEASKFSHHPTIDIDTPADKTLKLLDKILKGDKVDEAEAQELRETILQAPDLRMPVRFEEQLMRNGRNPLDNEVSQSLIQLLSAPRAPKQGQVLAALDEEPEQQHQDSDPAPSIMFSQNTVTDEAAHALVAVCMNIPEELNDVLSKVNDWQFDAFRLERVSNGRPLSLLAFYIFKRHDITKRFQMDDHKLVKFLMRIEDGYPNNPYHNRIHAADVLQSLHVLLMRGGLTSDGGCCDDSSLLSCYLSAIIHDFEHKGVNNDYLVRSGDALAILYNDKSPMENHHLAAAFQLMTSDEFNFMRKMPHKTREAMRKQIIDMVLATDMKSHFSIHSQFQNKMKQLNGARTSGGSGNHRSSKASLEGDAKVYDEDQKSLILQVALKCADLGHLASPRLVHQKWVSFLEEEFFRQGDREKHNTLSVSPLMDREKNGITKSQVGFFDIVALPLFQSFAQAFSDATPMLEAVKDNYVMWKEEASKNCQPDK